MAENQILTDEEKALVEASAPYQEYVKAHPEASADDFLKIRVEFSQVFTYVRKYNKNLDASGYFSGLKKVTRQSILEDFISSPLPEKLLTANTIKPQSETTESQSVAAEEKKKVPAEETKTTEKTPESDIPEKTEPSAEEAKKAVSEEEKNPASTPHSEKKEKKPAFKIKCDRKLDFKTDANFLAFLENIPEFKTDFDNAAEQSEENLAKRQKIVDYFRFMEGGKRSREAIEKQDWTYLQKEYAGFPKAPTEFLLSLYEKHLENGGEAKPRRTERLQRLIGYRFNDIRSGKRRIGSDDELKAIEAFLSAENSRNQEFGESLSSAIQQAIEDYKTSKAEKEAERQRQREERAAAREAARLKKEQEEAQARSEIPAGEVIENVVSTKDKNAEKEEPDAVTIHQDISAENNPLQQQNDKIEDEDVIVTINQLPKEEKKAETLTKKKEKNGLTPEDPADEELSPEKKEEKDNAWIEETERGWKDYGLNHKKIIETDKTEEKLAVRIFENEDKAKAQDAEAQVRYESSTDVYVGGRGNEVPDIGIFENLVAQSKKVSTKIRFGNIADEEFKAKLMIACLRDPDIKMIDAPKVEEFKNLSPEIKEILDAELEKQGLVEPSGKGKDKSHQAREKIRDRNNGNDDENTDDNDYQENRRYQNKGKDNYRQNQGDRRPYNGNRGSNQGGGHPYNNNRSQNRYNDDTVKEAVRKNFAEVRSS